MNWGLCCECIWGSDVWLTGETTRGAGAMRAAAQGYRCIECFELAGVGVSNRVNWFYDKVNRRVN